MLLARGLPFVQVRVQDLSLALQGDVGSGSEPDLSGGFDRLLLVHGS